MGIQNDITETWITPWDSKSGIVSLNIGLPISSPIHVEDKLYFERNIRTVAIGLLNRESLAKIRDAINKHLGG